MRRNSATTPYSKKSFGQNFLTDSNYIRRIVDSLNLGPDDSVVEIGPGRGALTEELIEKAKNVIAIELDRDMICLLNERFADRGNFWLVEQDVLQIHFTDLLGGQSADFRPVKLVANLPYYISTAILQRLIEERAMFSEVVLMFQREVVDRITAAAGTSERGFLTVLTEAYFFVEKLFDVPPNAFRPAPKIWSSVVRLTPKGDTVVNDELFRAIVSCGFTHKRKTLLNNLKRCFTDSEKILAAAAIDPSRRAESLSLEEWHRLSAAGVQSAES